MGFRTFIFIGILTCFCTAVFAQDYFSYGGGNFSGLNQVISNPAAAADNRLKLDVTITGFDVTANNSWFRIKRQALKNSGSLTKPQFPTSWKNVTPSVPDNVFKNFSVINSGKTRAAIIENRILLPSFMLQLDAKNSIAFTWSMRQIANIDGISQQLATLFEHELSLNVTQNNPVHIKNLSAVQMTWTEYGFTYARVLKDKNQHFIKAGITPKLLQGIESAFVVIKNLDFLFSNKDTSSYLNSNFSYAHSANTNLSPGTFYRYTSKPSLGLDLGIIYEWRPGFKNYKYRPDGKTTAWRKDLNKYKLKLGASIVDIGKIKFDKQGTNYDLDINVTRDNFTQLTSVKDYNQFDSLLKANFSNPNQAKQFSILLPMALNTQVDYSINRFFYLNLSTHITNFYTSLYKVHNYSAICFAPRFEHYWVDVSLPFTFNALSAKRFEYLMTGLNVRVGPLSFGSNNVVPLFKGDVAAANFYVLLKVSVPYKQIKDVDRDGVTDKKDLCPLDSGDVALGGCPDRDHDRIPDKDDACPHQPGLAAFRGCPDTDGDGIKDSEDACPAEKGPVFLKGCPDLDGDSIPDKDDACPDVPGLKQFKGCPDTDQDGVIDKDDLCPLVKGLIKYQGCPDSDNDGIHNGIDECPEVAGPGENKGCPWPDTDKDGIVDRVDSCITVAGIPAYKGCPEPVKLALVEKRIIEKAFSSLEFESGKDIIKPASYSSLNALAKLLLLHKTSWKVKLSGHTDNEGTEAGNLILSENRAKAVQSFLVKKGLPVENTIVEWFGQSRPVADNITKTGMKKNRRVEMAILLKED